MTCKICNHFQGNYSSILWLKDLRASAVSCYYCYILLAGLRGCLGNHAKDRPDLQGRENLPISVDQNYLQVLNTDFPKEIVPTFTIEIFALDGSTRRNPSSWDKVRTDQRIQSRVNLSNVVKIAQHWMADCNVNHESTMCEGPQPLDIAIRMVDVGESDADIRLVEFPHGTRDLYTCLSHCWGAAAVITTTKATIQQHRHSIAWGMLSKTFRDAIVLTRALGFRYVWIDSLCIIQDDLHDWERESAKMSSVYANGALTIAATHAKDGSDGLFLDANETRISGMTPLKEPYELCFRRLAFHQSGGVMEGRDHPLFRRGWVFQERLLSPRILHFGGDELFYECNSAAWCECGLKRNRRLLKTEYAKLIKRLNSASPRRLDYQHLDLAQHLWRSMVCNYADLLLSKPADRLTALSGLARQMAAVRKSAYLAGLWEDSLIADLLWSGNNYPRPDTKIAPTWSWASTTNAVFYYHDLDYDPHFEYPDYNHVAVVDDCNVILSGHDEFGRVEGGTLTICGSLATGWIEKGDPEKTHAGYNMCLPNGKWSFQPDYNVTKEGISHVAEHSQIYTLCVSTANDYDFIGGNRLVPSTKIYSLVLRAAPDQPGFYERIGLMETTQIRPAIDSVTDLYSTAERCTVRII